MKNKISPPPAQIKEFWDKYPVGADFILPAEGKEYFLAYDSFKFTQEPHILEELRKLDLRGKRVLEIGVGQGAEGQRIIEAGALYTGIDLSPKNIERMRARCRLFSLPYEKLIVMNGEALAFPDATFDLVFSHGVLHHSPRIQKIITEIYRVLKPGGMVVVMLYHRHSLNYHLSIKILRRLGFFLLFLPGVSRVVSLLTGEKEERVKKHLINWRSKGWSYLRLDNWIARATDGPENVYSAVYSRYETRKLFSLFVNLDFKVYHLNERHFPLLRILLPARAKQALASRWGWHLWVKGNKPCSR